MPKTPPLFLAVFLLTLAPQHLFAGAREDAHYIVQQTVNKHLYEGAIKALGPTLVGAMETVLRKKGVVVSDVQTFQDLLLAAFLDEFTAKMKIASEKHYLEVFNAEELAGIAAFYRSDAGQALLAQSPELLAFGTQKGREIGRLAGMHAGPTVARQMKERGIVITSNKTMMQRLLDALE